MDEPQVFYPIGSHVRVAAGCLAGVSGVIIELTENDNHVLCVDGWGYSARLLVSGDVLMLDEAGVLA